MSTNWIISRLMFVPNGCGPKAKGLLGSVSRFAIPNFVFKDACDDHDDEYFVGGCKRLNIDARYNADVTFYNKMKSNIPFYLKPVLLPIAYLYFKTVRNAGETYFNWFQDVETWFDHLGFNQIELKEGVEMNEQSISEVRKEAIRLLERGLPIAKSKYVDALIKNPMPGIKAYLLKQQTALEVAYKQNIHLIKSKGGKK